MKTFKQIFLGATLLLFVAAVAQADESKIA